MNTAQIYLIYYIEITVGSRQLEPLITGSESDFLYLTQYSYFSPLIIQCFDNSYRFSDSLDSSSYRDLLHRRGRIKR